MNRRTLGRSGLSCSVIGLGTMGFGTNVYGRTDKAVAHATICAALNAGINVFDSAPLYGSAEVDGCAESVLGAALGARRDEALIFTKFGRAPSLGALTTDFSARGARSSTEASLRRLKTDRIDVLFFHSPLPRQLAT